MHRIIKSTTMLIFVAAIPALLVMTPTVNVSARDASKEASSKAVEEMEVRILTAVRKIGAGSLKMQQATSILKQGGDAEKAKRIMNRGQELMGEGEAALEKIAESLEKNPELKRKMKKIWATCENVMSGCRMMRAGIMLMEKDKKTSPDSEKKMLEGRKKVEDAADGLEAEQAKKAKR